MVPEQMVDLSEDEMQAISGGNWRCLLGGALLVGSIYSLNPLGVAMALGGLHYYGCLA